MSSERVSVPVIRVTAPGRNLGKTWLATRLIAALSARGLRVGAIKHSHHGIAEDRAGADSDLMARAGAAHVDFAGGDGTLGRDGQPALSLIRLLHRMAPETDVVIVEGFRSDDMGARIELEPGSPVRAHLWTMDDRSLGTHLIDDVEGIASTLSCALRLCPEGDDATREAIRRAAASHGHRCPGLALGVRLARHGLAALGAHTDARDLAIEVETTRCAADAIAAVTGCTLGSGRLLLNNTGRLAATLSAGGRAVRVAPRAGLREFARNACCADDAHGQERFYRSAPLETLFTLTEVPVLQLPPRHPGRALCTDCREEVSLGVAVTTPDGVCCPPCSATRRAAAALQLR